jgi:hypothetical protein
MNICKSLALTFLGIILYNSISYNLPSYLLSSVFLVGVYMEGLQTIMELTRITAISHFPLPLAMSDPDQCFFHQWITQPPMRIG